ncbi:hypothetical protein U8C36_17640 [Sinorhizobium medicae]|uniref:hypothetical protein n=1 Tax=Sinorhizobium medicae TaxID=110321 RepID=UPI002AF6BB9C|nr:hypothetical protein [Sinorhizobium medicae]WQO51710.1 hypothetical protein U8C36_17640 [Sinorhizobium medicae]
MTDVLKLNFQHCYGIGKLEAELEFAHKGIAIYAANGVMKTSFARTMMDLSKGNSPSDLAFPDRNSKFEVTLNGDPIVSDEIFVVQSYDEKYSSNEVSTLLANSALKQKYENVHRSIGEAKKELDKSLRGSAGFGEKSRENLDPIIKEIFKDDYYDALLGVEDELGQTSASSLADANYKILFDPKVQQLLADQTVGDAVADFAKKYDEITEKSPILRRNFQYHNATDVQQQLAANHFFDAGHSISLADKNSLEKTEYSSNEALRDMIEAEKLRVFEDEGIKARFDAFNAKIKNKELQVFRDYITENKHLIPELTDRDAFKRKLWIQYLLRAQGQYSELLAKYRIGKVELESIIAEADASRGDWDDVIADFNRRFLYLPFELFVENKSDAILQGTSPSVGFIFRNSGDEKRYSQNQKQDLLSVLSTGEARALYILDIMYEVYVKWKYRKKTLFVFDDIADSFDYKNKFAIIDFLEDVTKAEETNFLAVVLTHNFDFLRTIASRGICPPHQCRLAFKTAGEIKLNNFDRSDIQSPFHKWKNRLAEPKITIAYIPFLRNVIEYTQGAKNPDGTDNPDYLILTRMVHYKDESDGLTFADYKDVFEKTFPNTPFPDLTLDLGIMDQIFATADICQNAEDGVNLEHKIVLSLATRVWAERYMIGKIRSDDPNFDPSRKQTGQLFQTFKDKFNNQTDEIGLLRRVNLITPANIHINAFMYEPILDMGFGELVRLYQDVKDIFV